MSEERELTPEEQLTEELATMTAAELVERQTEVAKVCLEECAQLERMRFREQQLANDLEAIREQIAQREQASGSVKRLTEIGAALVARLEAGIV